MWGNQPLYGVTNHCESIGNTFEILTFVVNPFRRHLMMTSAILQIANILYYILKFSCQPMLDKLYICIVTSFITHLIDY